MQSRNLYTLSGIGQYRSSRPDTHLIVDTNVFLLYLIGSYDKQFLGQCSLMKDNGKYYGEKHFDLIKKIFEIFLYNLVITPHILSEINMLARQIKPKPPEFDQYFLRIVKELEKCIESNVELRVLCKDGAIAKFGFADISLIESAKSRNWAILTDEFALQKNYGEKLPVIFFSNVVANELQLK